MLKVIVFNLCHGMGSFTFLPHQGLELSLKIGQKYVYKQPMKLKPRDLSEEWDKNIHGLLPDRLKSLQSSSMGSEVHCIPHLFVMTNFYFEGNFQSLGLLDNGEVTRELDLTYDFWGCIANLSQGGSHMNKAAVTIQAKKGAHPPEVIS